MTRRCADSESGRRGQILQRLIIVAQNLTGGRSTESVAERLPQVNPSGWAKSSPYCHSELRERAEAQSENVNSICHPELADLRTAEQSESRIASRLSRLEQSSLGETLRAWSKSKTDSGSIQHGVLSVLLDRSRNKFGMTLKFMQFWIATPAEPARNDRGWLVHVAFTMAEILLSLTIIGVVAAITLPSLTGNINERTWDTQRKALHARLAQAIALMPALNGYGSYIEATSSASAVDTVAETFVTSGLAKVLKINNICDFEHLTDCGITKTINPLTGHGAIDTPTKWSELNSYTINPLTYDNTQVIKPLKDTRAAGMETANGESISILYNPECQFYMNERSSIENYNLSSKICLNLIYDLNGQKGPNTVGKDIGFITVFYPTDSVIAAPLPTNTLSSSGTDQKSAIALCKKQNNESRLPTIDELGSIYLNQKLVYGSLYTTQTDYWSATKTGTNKGWYMGFTSGNYWTYSNSVTRNCKVQCIKR